MIYFGGVLIGTNNTQSVYRSVYLDNTVAVWNVATGDERSLTLTPKNASPPRLLFPPPNCTGRWSPAVPVSRVFFTHTRRRPVLSFHATPNTVNYISASLLPTVHPSIHLSTAISSARAYIFIAAFRIPFETTVVHSYIYTPTLSNLSIAFTSSSLAFPEGSYSLP